MALPFLRRFAAGLTLIVLGSALFAQEAASPGSPQLAPGVLTVIPAHQLPGETTDGPQPMVEVVHGIPNLDWTPNFSPKTQTLYDQASRVFFRQPVWGFEFAFKPVRMISVDVPQPSGKMLNKRIWYLVYRVRNTGQALTTETDPRGVIQVQRVNYATRRFFPHFVLRSHEFDKEYLDRIIPSAQKAIQKREGRGVKLHNSVEMTRVKIPLSDERVKRDVWGVAMWEDVDPRIDFFSVYIQGLSNAFTFVDPQGAFQPGDPPGTGRLFLHKTLQLNFWRPGDSVFEDEDEIRFGVPIESRPHLQKEILDKYGLTKRLDYLWVYH